MQVIKRNGDVEELDLEKMHKVVIQACEGISGVSPSLIEISSNLKLYNKIKTVDIQETLIKSASSLITEDTPNYQYAAGRLVNHHIRKEVYNGDPIPDLLTHIKKVVGLGFYDKQLLTMYSEDEWHQMDKWVDHGKDDKFTYAAMEMWRSKYLVRNRIKNQLLETPQFAYMLISAFFFHNYPKETRLSWVKRFYDALSNFAISLPTPILAGVRTPNRQFSSCTLIDADDSLDSIFAVAQAVGLYVANRAGIGINGGRIRAVGSKIRNGEAYSTGVIPFYRVWESAIRSCHQGNIRSGSGTVYAPFWHYEIEDILVLKNNKGTDDNRLRHVDWAIQFSKLAYERLIEGSHITLFDPNDVPELYEAFFKNEEEFKQLYEAAERKTSIRKKKIPALELFSKFVQERKGTGRVYAMNVDHANSHGAFRPEVAPIKMSNLCLEILLHTKPLHKIDDPEAEIALCILGSVNLAAIKDPDDFKEPCELLVRALDELIDFQSYPVEAARRSATKRRTLGIGINNLAYWLAKNDLNYQDITKEGLKKIDYLMEGFSYNLIKASADLAVEKGPCEFCKDTKYAQGLVALDTYKKDVDSLVPPRKIGDGGKFYGWQNLREQLKTTGIRNSTLSAVMPSETNSLLINATNGVEPPRALVSIKQSKDGVVAQVVPEIYKLKNKYDLLWNQKSPEGYLKIMAVIQKWIDQACSVNTSYNPVFYPNHEIPMSEMLNHILFCYKHGIPTLYYCNTYDGAGEVEVQQTECEGCKL